jgi:hypothetical protein
MKIKLKCNNCQKIFERNKKDVKPNKSSYCSRKCALTNASHIKYKDHKKTITYCVSCNCVIDNRSKKKMCMSCHNTSTKTKIENLTIGDIKNKHKSRKFLHWYTSEIRNFNRDWNKHLLLLPCQVCGYSRKIHLAHIKPICSFPDSALLKEINSESNNLVLCPNHHSEFDDGFISLNDIPKRNK